MLFFLHVADIVMYVAPLNAKISCWCTLLPYFSASPDFITLSLSLKLTGLQSLKLCAHKQSVMLNFRRCIIFRFHQVLLEFLCCYELYCFYVRSSLFSLNTNVIWYFSGKNGTGASETKHWQDMITKPRQTIVQWHRLKPE